MKIYHFTRFHRKSSSQVVLIKTLAGTSGSFAIKSMFIRKFKKGNKQIDK